MEIYWYVIIGLGVFIVLGSCVVIIIVLEQKLKERKDRIRMISESIIEEKIDNLASRLGL